MLNQKITNLDKKSNQFDIKLKLNTEIQSELRSKMQSKSGEVTFAPLLIAISQLEEEILSGKAYEGDINNIRTIIKPHQGLIPNINMAVDMLDKNAKNGIATKLELIRQFARLAPDAQTAYKKANAKNWIDQTFENVKGLISIRKIGNSPDLSPISLAEYALAQDDLAAAISALEILNDVKMVGEWLTVAKQRVLAINNLSILRKESIALLTKNKLEITQ